MDKLIVVLDTNIFISSVFWEASPYEIVKKAINQEIIVFISNDIIKEIKEVKDSKVGSELNNGMTLYNLVLHYHLVKQDMSLRDYDTQSDTQRPQRKRRRVFQSPVLEPIPVRI